MKFNELPEVMLTRHKKLLAKGHKIVAEVHAPAQTEEIDGRYHLFVYTSDVHYEIILVYDDGTIWFQKAHDGWASSHLNIDTDDNYILDY